MQYAEKQHSWKILPLMFADVLHCHYQSSASQLILSAHSNVRAMLGFSTVDTVSLTHHSEEITPARGNNV